MCCSSLTSALCQVCCCCAFCHAIFRSCAETNRFFWCCRYTAEVQSLSKALLFFGLADVSDKVMAKMKAFVSALEQIEFPVPPTYPARMLGINARELPQLLHRLRALTIRRNAIEPAAQTVHQDPRLSWAQFRSDTSY